MKRVYLLKGIIRGKFLNMCLNLVAGCSSESLIFKKLRTKFKFHRSYETSTWQYVNSGSCSSLLVLGISMIYFSWHWNMFMVLFVRPFALRGNTPNNLVIPDSFIVSFPDCKVEFLYSLIRLFLFISYLFSGSIWARWGNVNSQILQTIKKKTLNINHFLPYFHYISLRIFVK